MSHCPASLCISVVVPVFVLSEVYFQPRMPPNYETPCLLVLSDNEEEKKGYISVPRLRTYVK